MNSDELAEMSHLKARAEKAEKELKTEMEATCSARDAGLEAWVHHDKQRERAEKAEAALAQLAKPLGSQADNFARVVTERNNAVATARAVMAEEARRAAKHSIESHRDRYGFPHEIQQHIESHIRALAPLPAGLCVLPVDLAEWITDHLTTELRNMNESDSCDDCGTLDDHESDCFALELERRIAALDTAGGETRHRNQPRACNCSWSLTGTHAQWCSTSDSTRGPR